MPDSARRDLLTAFGVAVRALRREHGWSPEEFTDRIGLHRTYIGDIERGERNLSLIDIDRIAVALDVSLAALMAELEKAR